MGRVPSLWSGKSDLIAATSCFASDKSSMSAPNFPGHLKINRFRLRAASGHAAPNLDNVAPGFSRVKTRSPCDGVLERAIAKFRPGLLDRVSRGAVQAQWRAFECACQNSNHFIGFQR